MNQYICECWDSDCPEVFSDRVFEIANSRRYTHNQYVLSPKCKHLADYIKVYSTKKYVLVKSLSN
jgi:hypothetical protein